MKKNILLALLLGTWGILGCQPSADPAEAVDCNLAANKALPVCEVDPLARTSQIDRNFDNYLSITLQRPLKQDEILSAKLVQGPNEVEIIFLIDRADPTSLNARVLKSKLEGFDAAATSVSLVLTYEKVNSSESAQWSLPLTLIPVRA